MVPLDEVCFTTGKDGKNHFLFQPNRLANKTVKSSTANFRPADTLGQKLNHRSKLQIDEWKQLLMLQNCGHYMWSQSIISIVLLSFGRIEFILQS